MNERIKELAVQSGFAYDPVKDQLWAIDGSRGLMVSFGLEKFAKLIVEEFEKQCNGYEEEIFKARISSSDFSVKNQLAAGESLCSSLKESIKKKFGVE